MVNMASTFSQSNIVYKLIADQILFNPKINSENYKITTEKIINKKKQNTLQKIYSKPGSNLGLLNISALCADELGAMASRENMDSILSGMAMSQTKPLRIFLSNPSPSRTHWSNEFLNNLQCDKGWEFFDFSCPVKIDPFSKEAKCFNPFYAHYLKTKDKIYKPIFDFVNKESEKAKKHGGESLISYRRFQLGQRVNTQVYSWVESDDIQIYKKPIKTLMKNPNLRCFICFDLSLTVDFSVFCCVWIDDQTDDIFFYPIMHVANTKLRRPTMQTQFQSWHDQGFITIQNRESLSRDIFLRDVLDFLETNKISYEKHCWDRNLTTPEWFSHFHAEPILYNPGPRLLTYPIRHIEARAKDHKLHLIGDNPVALWMFENAICSQKSKGFVNLDKTSWPFSIDLPCALTLAIRYYIDNPRPGFYGFSV